jgi:hypothetical protein
MGMKIIGCVMIYLLIGAVIAGFADIDFDKETADFVMMLLIWPIVLILVALALVSGAIRAVLKAINRKRNE